ncbi:bifunctional UDP-N-acetylglucosamine pyrophosphorylase / Glucosamine-1-phosphate N-acetyltransferase [Methylophilaceae bacterium]|nr:bifunctional UDP-N-acetylglucosamine pyrophosphorylase / Glucosamine-1-phosphate N-acetyltransferase [Methylophilaceae bacterium]
MTTSTLNIVILAAGKGTRMNSVKPKVLHELAGRPLLAHVINAARQLDPDRIIVVYGYGGETVPETFKDENLTWVRQSEQLGTGHAVQQALPALAEDGKTLILLGDVPLLNVESCRKLLQQTLQLGLLTVRKNDPTGYGRIVRDAQGRVNAIVEHKDASLQQRTIDEVNTGIMAVDSSQLKSWLSRLKNHNAQGEYYLTDIVSLAVEDGFSVASETTSDESSVEGVNSKQDLAGLERVYQLRKATALMQAGVTLNDPFRIDIRGDLEVGRDVEIDIGCIFEGRVSLADGVKIGAYCVIRDSSIGAGTTIAPFTHMDQVRIADECRIGPYARLRPGTELSADTHIGNFVELKNTQVDVGSKINHLSYVGDTTVGKQVNIGAGTITCNYDGANKFRTVIEDHAFIGSDSQLVAPVTIGAGATIGAGSTITKDAPAGELTLSRGRQTTISNWKRPVKVKR